MVIIILSLWTPLSDYLPVWQTLDTHMNSNSNLSLRPRKWKIDKVFLGLHLTKGFNCATKRNSVQYFEYSETQNKERVQTFVWSGEFLSPIYTKLCWDYSTNHWLNWLICFWSVQSVIGAIISATIAEMTFRFHRYKQ